MRNLLTLGAAFITSAASVIGGWQFSMLGQDSELGAGNPAAVSSDSMLAEPPDVSSLNSTELRSRDKTLESRTQALVQQYGAVSDDERRKKVEVLLAAVVAQHFAVRQAIREREIANLEKEVARLRELLQQREDAEQEIVQGRVEQLIRSARGLGWDGQGEPVTGGRVPPSPLVPARPAMPRTTSR